MKVRTERLNSKEVVSRDRRYKELDSFVIFVINSISYLSPVITLHCSVKLCCNVIYPAGN